MGSLSILNAGAGDIKISYNTQDAAEAIRAKRMISEMLARGYALLVENKDGSYSRATKFDAKRSEYIVADFEPQTAPSAPAETQETEQASSQPKRGRPAKKSRRVPMEGVKAVGVARSAGG